MFAIIFLFVFISAIYVFADALNRKIHPIGAVLFGLGTLCLWIIFFPLYLICRPDKPPMIVYHVTVPPGVPYPQQYPQQPPQYYQAVSAPHSSPDIQERHYPNYVCKKCGEKYRGNFGACGICGGEIEVSR